jgi:hypothetical protein
MLARTTCDLRIAEHAATTARINRQAWRQEQATRPPVRAALAALLVALAVRIAPAALPARPASKALAAPTRA